MREILFRGKREDNGEWVEGYLIKRCRFYMGERLSGLDCFIIDCFDDEDQVIPETVGQYVDYQDYKTDEKLFDGDILRHPDGTEFEIIWDKCLRQYKAKYAEDYCVSIGLQIGYKGQAIKIGTIHDEITKEVK